MPYNPGQFNTPLHSGIAIASLAVDKLVGIHKFGYNGAVNSSAAETIWDGGGVYDFYPDDPVDLDISSSSGATDDGVQIKIEGLDQDYERYSETVTLDSSGTATTQNPDFKRVFRAYVVEGQAADGTITINESGDTGNVAAKILPEYQQTQMAVFTTADREWSYITAMSGGYDKNNSVEYRIMVREEGSVFRCKGVVSAFAGGFDRHFEMPLEIRPQSDIRIDCVAGATGAANAAFDIFSVKP